MSRGPFLAWLWRHRIDAAAVPKLTFYVPISRYTKAADLARRDDSMRHAIWALAGDAFTHHRHQSAFVRKEARRCLALLRRTWAAHSAGRVDLARAEFAAARDAWLSASHEVAARGAFADQKRQLDAVTFGKRGGRPPSEWDDDWLRQFEIRKAKNPALSKSEICKRIAADWRDEKDVGRSARTIEDGVTRAQKVRRKPPFSR